MGVNKSNKRGSEAFSRTPNTASNSSGGEGSNKKIGTIKSKLTTSSKVYQATAVRPNKEFSNDNLCNIPNQSYGNFPQKIMNPNFQSLPLQNNAASAQSAYFSRISPSLSNNFDPKTIRYFEDQEHLQNKGLIPQFGHKFMSDTRINPPKEFILFGDNGIQELEHSQNFQESESEGDNIMESIIKEGVLDDIESPNSNSTANGNLQIDPKFKNEDEGSVSSGSENQDEVNFEILDEGKSSGI